MITLLFAPGPVVKHYGEDGSATSRMDNERIFWRESWNSAWLRTAGVLHLERRDEKKVPFSLAEWKAAVWLLCTTAISRGAPGRVSRALWISTEAPGSPPAPLLLHRGKAFSDRRHRKCLSVQITNSFPCCPFEKLRDVLFAKNKYCWISSHVFHFIPISVCKHTQSKAATKCNSLRIGALIEAG